MQNVSNVMEKVAARKRRQLWAGLLGKFEKIYRSHSSETEKIHACSDTYVNCHPGSSWEHLTLLLYAKDEMTAVELARPFLPPKGKSIS